MCTAPGSILGHWHCTVGLCSEIMLVINNHTGDSFTYLEDSSAEMTDSYSVLIIDMVLMDLLFPVLCFGKHQQNNKPKTVSNLRFHFPFSLSRIRKNTTKRKRFPLNEKRWKENWKRKRFQLSIFCFQFLFCVLRFSVSGILKTTKAMKW